MKQKLVMLFAFAMISISATFAQNDNGLIGRAQGAAHECLQNFNSSDWNINANVNDVAICFVSGTIKEVVFIATPKLPKGIYPMVRIMPIVVARVQFDCNGDIISTDCY